jgi:hypothetical protein
VGSNNSTLDVVDDATARPCQQRRDDETDTLAAAGWRKTEHVLRSGMTQILMIDLAEHDTVGAQQAGRADLLDGRPAR